MDRLLLTLPCENGELFYCLSGRRIALARCKPKIEIYEHTTRVRAIGGAGGLKRLYASIVLCEDLNFTRPVDEAFLNAVESFDLSADVQRTDGIFEVFRFNSIQLQDIGNDGSWQFQLNEPQDVYRRLLTI